MPDGLYVTMPLGVLNCASTKPLVKNEVEFPSVYPVLFLHLTAFICSHPCKILS